MAWLGIRGPDKIWEKEKERCWMNTHSGLGGGAGVPVECHETALFRELHRAQKLHQETRTLRDKGFLGLAFLVVAR